MAEAEILILADATQAEAELAKFQAEWQAAMKTMTTGITDTAKRVGMAAGIAFAGQAAVFGLAYAAVAEYEHNLREAAVVGGFTETQMWKLNDAINASAKAWGVDATEISKGVLLLAHGSLRGEVIVVPTSGTYHFVATLPKNEAWSHVMLRIKLLPKNS